MLCICWYVMTEKNLFGLCKLQTSIIAHTYRFLYAFFVKTHSISFIIQLHPTTLSNFSFTIFPFFFYFSLQRCIICAKLFYRLKKNPNSMHRVCYYTFLLKIQGIAFMFIFEAYFLKKKEKFFYSPRKKANYKTVL